MGIWERVAPLSALDFNAGDSIMVQPFPAVDAAKQDEQVLADIEWVKRFIVGIRNIRGEMDIAPSKPLPALLRNVSSEDERRLGISRTFIDRLARLESTTVLKEGEEAPASAAAVVGEMEILIPMAGLIDKEAELARIAKAMGKLEQDVAQSWIQCFPDPIRDEMKTLINQQVNFKLMTIGEIQRLLMAKYLCWKLDFDWPQAKNAVTSSLYDFCQNIKSFIETIDILMEIGLKKEHILGYSRLLRSDSTSLRKLIDTYPRFLGDEIGPVLMRHPVLCTFNFDNMEQNLKQLSYVKFPVSTLIRHLDLLNEEPWQLREKLIHIERYPEMRVLCHNPRFPEVFKNIETATLRLEALRSVNQRNISLKAINQCNNSSYLKMIQENDQRREVNLEAKRYLVNLLNRSPKEIRNALRSHPHWDQLDLTNMILVVEFLQEHQFSAEQIFNGIQLVLYPLSEVARGMTEFISELDQSTILMKIKPAKRLNPHVLQLLLYIIERKSHFSGNSVLSNDDQTVGV